MTSTAPSEQYVVLPRSGLRAEPGTSTAETRQFLADLSAQVRVVDSIGPEGAKLIEATPEAALALRRDQPGLRVVPVRYYVPAVARRVIDELAAAAPRAPGSPVRLEVVSATDGAPVVGAFVVAFVDFAKNQGDQGVTDAAGKVALALGGPHTKLDRLYVYPIEGYWSRLQEGLVAKDGTKVEVDALDLGYVDGLRHYYGNAPDDAGEGVTVGVIDTGVGPHSDLTVAGGANTVPGEDPDDFGDNGQHHGTHVAGIIAAHGDPPSGIRGVAPAVSLRAYRVFAKGSGQGSSFAIAKAIDTAVADGCDLINMSLGGGQPDDTLKAAIEAARTGGSLCVIAAGNGDRSPVAFPASEAMALAVSALGRTGTFPAGVAETGDVADPHGTDPADFIAAFSNVGPEIDLTGPGVGIISTVPGGYAEISGTSMACPAVTGMAARVLGKSKVLKMPRDAKRSDAIAKAVLKSAKSLGFAPDFAGHGLPES